MAYHIADKSKRRI